MSLFQKLAERRLLVLIICLGIIGYGFYKVVFTYFLEVDSVRAETIAVNQKIASLPKKIHDLRRLRDDYTEAVSALENINSLVTHEALCRISYVNLRRFQRSFHKNFKHFTG